MARKKKNEATAVASPRSREDNVFHTIKIHIKGGCVVEVDNLPELFDYEIIDHDVSEE
jgi:hypothetical protein